MRIFSLIIALLFTLYLSAQEERILQFDVDIQLEENRSIEITENIKVYAGGRQIRRGITRGLPITRILGPHGTQNMRYKIISVEKDGKKEKFKSETNNNIRTLYIGDKDIFLEPGIYNYEIRYRVKNQIAFYEDYEEFYWNAIGHLSNLRVENATIHFHFPERAKIVQSAVYTGTVGSRASEITVENRNNSILYELTKPLEKYEGVTIGIGFENGTFEQPSLLQKYAAGGFFGLSIFIFLFYGIYTWIKHGIDPPKPPSYPVFSPPDDLSPASINYIHHSLSKTSAISASIIELVNKGKLSIERKESKAIFSKKSYYVLTNLRCGTEDLPMEQAALLEELFEHEDVIELDGEYNPDVAAASRMHQKSVQTQHKKFLTQGNNAKKIVFPSIFLIFSIIITLFLGLFSGYNTGFSLFYLIPYFFMGIFFLIVYAWLIKKPSKEKLDLQSRIKGFKMYLGMTEKDRMNVLNPPEMTIGHFEKLLPYAFALNVENKWMSRFDNILKESGYLDRNPHVQYYTDSSFGRSFNNSLSSTSTQPSSSGSSGSGGGGFSGGGGGGGSVGGW